MQVSADDVGAFAATAVTDDGQDAPGWCVHQVEHRDAICGRRAADVVPVAVGDDDDVTRAGPVPFAVIARDPTRTLGDDVKDDQTFGAGMEHAGDGVRHGLERERIGPFRAEEDRAFESQLLEGAAHRLRRICGVLISTRGA